MIKAPFNFVPISSKVFSPDEWSAKISNDIPFSDGLSGVIELTINAESKIFVRNGHPKNVEDNSFSNIDKQYFIPGSSLRGCIRNVLEIMSYSKLSLDKTAMFAQREWDNGELYPLKKNQSSFRCGYLLYDAENDKYRIEDHGKPYRIGHDEIDKYLNNGDQFTEHFRQDSKFDITKEKDGFDPKTAAFKYFLVGDDQKLENLSFSESNTSTEYSTRLQVDSNGSINGSIVLTGQPDKWMWPRPTEKDKAKRAGKFYEFVFPSETQTDYDIPKSTFEHFRFIYSESTEWPRAKKLLETSGIPVFFRLEKGGVKDFGLAYLYKLPYDKSPFDVLPDDHRKTDRIDLAEAIFGYVHGKNMLKSRVFFGNALLQGTPDVAKNELYMILSSPKASYYPIYVQQSNVVNGKVTEYDTYNSNTIAGWKRYHTKQEISFEDASGDDKKNLATKMIPLNSGTFKSKIVFHNLNEIELGALLSAITFHNTEGCYHQIGQGKPYGFGKITIKANLSKISETKDPVDLMARFEQCMQREIDARWNETEQIVNLFTLAHEKVSANAMISEYMHMDNKKNDDEFTKAKKALEFLQNFTALSKKRYYPKSLTEELERKIREQEEIKNRRISQMIENADALVNEGKFDSALNLYREAAKMGGTCDTKIHNCLKLLSNSIISQADAARSNGNYAEAIELYKKAESYGVITCSEQIGLCERKMNEATMGFSEFITITKDTSIGAIAGKIKKYSGDITDDDCNTLGKQLKEAFAAMNSKSKKSWGDFKNWKPIVDALHSEEKAQIIFKYIS